MFWSQKFCLFIFFFKKMHQDIKFDSIQIMYKNAQLPAKILA